MAFTSYPAVVQASLIGGRSVNQDAAADAYYGDPADGGYTVVALADGLGSVPGSEQIAEAAVHAACGLAGSLDFQCDPVHLIDTAKIVVSSHARFAENREVFTAFADGDYRAPDTTLVVATVTNEGEVHVGWIGDSRAYLRLADDRVIALTRDHTPVPDGRTYVLTQTLCHYLTGPDRAHWYGGSYGDHRVLQVLLTSDGVHDVLPHDVITYALTEAPTPARAVRWLTSWAVRASGPQADNATCVLLTVP